MKIRRAAKRDRYSITITSQSKAYKAARSVTVSRRKILAVVISFAMVFVLSVGAAGVAVFQAYHFRGQADTITRQVSENTAILDAYKARIAVLMQAEMYRNISGLPDEPDAADDFNPVMAQEDTPESAMGVTGFTFTAIPVRDAVEQINEAFMAGIEEQIAVARLGTPADEVEIVYSGDVEGDSDTVNNWADVLSVFAVLSGYDLITLQAITEDDCAQLERIHDDMNRVGIGSETSVEETQGAEDESGASITKLTLCVSIDSMDCAEYAALLGWDGDQKDKLETLMSPDYYMTFAALLGIDLYDGLNSEELSEILAGLEPGRIGTLIVEAALTRMGDPYSRRRRGLGDYLDCSYFTYWAYKQAGITLPTTSVEQARYCYNHSCEVEIEELQPGDLLFWSKTSCHCGRWREIHHSGIYLGNNMIIDASSSKGCVVIRRIWGVGGEGGWRLSMCARPYMEDTAAALESAANSGT